MSLIDRMLKQLGDRGLSVGPGDKPGELKLHGPRSEVTPEVMRALKAFKPALLERFGRPEPADGHQAAPVPLDPEPEPEPEPEPPPEREECRVCGRDVTDPEDRERLADPAFCDRGGGREYQDCDGVLHPESERCPFKPPRR